MAMSRYLDTFLSILIVLSYYHVHLMKYFCFFKEARLLYFLRHRYLIALLYFYINRQCRMMTLIIRKVSLYYDLAIKDFLVINYSVLVEREILILKNKI